MVNTTDIPQLLITVQEASQAISISAKTVRNFIRTGRLSSVNLGIRMTRIRLQDLILMAEEYGIQVEIPSYTPVSN